jgi:NADH-quinone oxidoreductase subunit H
VAGYHLEYSSVKFALFFMAEYSNMVVASFVIATLFLGGYQVPYASTETLLAHPHGVLAAIGALLIFKGGVLGYVVGLRAKGQASLYRGMEKMEPFLWSWAGYALAAVGLVILVLSWGWSLPEWAPSVLAAVLQVGCLLAKVVFFCWLFVWVRWTLPRFRYDQLMKMGWKALLPLALANLLVTGVVLLIQK